MSNYGSPYPGPPWPPPPFLSPPFPPYATLVPPPFHYGAVAIPSSAHPQAGFVQPNRGYVSSPARRSYCSDTMTTMSDRFSRAVTSPPRPRSFIETSDRDSIVYNAGFTFRMGQASRPSRVHNHVEVSPAYSVPRTQSGSLTKEIDKFLRRSDHTLDRWHEVLQSRSSSKIASGSGRYNRASSLAPRMDSSDYSVSSASRARHSASAAAISARAEKHLDSVGRIGGTGYRSTNADNSSSQKASLLERIDDLDSSTSSSGSLDDFGTDGDATGTMDAFDFSDDTSAEISKLSTIDLGPGTQGSSSFDPSRLDDLSSDSDDEYFDVLPTTAAVLHPTVQSGVTGTQCHLPKPAPPPTHSRSLPAVNKLSSSFMGNLYAQPRRAGGGVSGPQHVPVVTSAYKYPQPIVTNFPDAKVVSIPIARSQLVEATPQPIPTLQKTNTGSRQPPPSPKKYRAPQPPGTPNDSRRSSTATLQSINLPVNQQAAPDIPQELRCNGRNISVPDTPATQKVHRAPSVKKYRAPQPPGQPPGVAVADIVKPHKDPAICCQSSATHASASLPEGVAHLHSVPTTAYSQQAPKDSNSALKANSVPGSSSVMTRATELHSRPARPGSPVPLRPTKLSIKVNPNLLKQGNGIGNLEAVTDTHLKSGAVDTRVDLRTVDVDSLVRNSREIIEEAVVIGAQAVIVCDPRHDVANVKNIRLEADSIKDYSSGGTNTLFGDENCLDAVPTKDLKGEMNAKGLASGSVSNKAGIDSQKEHAKELQAAGVELGDDAMEFFSRKNTCHTGAQISSESSVGNRSSEQSLGNPSGHPGSVSSTNGGSSEVNSKTKDNFVRPESSSNANPDSGTMEGRPTSAKDSVCNPSSSEVNINPDSRHESNTDIKNETVNPGGVRSDVLGSCSIANPSDCNSAESNAPNPSEELVKPQDNRDIDMGSKMTEDNPSSSDRPAGGNACVSDADGSNLEVSTQGKDFTGSEITSNEKASASECLKAEGTSNEVTDTGEDNSKEKKSHPAAEDDQTITEPSSRRSSLSSREGGPKRSRSGRLSSLTSKFEADDVSQKSDSGRSLSKSPSGPKIGKLSSRQLGVLAKDKRQEHSILKSLPSPYSKPFSPEPVSPVPTVKKSIGGINLTKFGSISKPPKEFKLSKKKPIDKKLDAKDKPVSNGDIPVSYKVKSEDISNEKGDGEGVGKNDVKQITEKIGDASEREDKAKEIQMPSTSLAQEAPITPVCLEHVDKTDSETVSKAVQSSVDTQEAEASPVDTMKSAVTEPVPFGSSSAGSGASNGISPMADGAFIGDVATPSRVKSGLEEMEPGMVRPSADDSIPLSLVQQTDGDICYPASATTFVELAAGASPCPAVQLELPADKVSISHITTDAIPVVKESATVEPPALSHPDDTAAAAASPYVSSEIASSCEISASKVLSNDPAVFPASLPGSVPVDKTLGSDIHSNGSQLPNMSLAVEPNGSQIPNLPLASGLLDNANALTASSESFHVSELPAVTTNISSSTSPAANSPAPHRTDVSDIASLVGGAELDPSAVQQKRKKISSRTPEEGGGEEEVYMDAIDPSQMDTLMPLPELSRSRSGTPLRPTSPFRVVAETEALLSETDRLLRRSRSRSSLARSFSRSLSGVGLNRLAEVTADLSEEHSTAQLAGERVEAEQAERMKLEKEVAQLQADVKRITTENNKLEMERLALRTEMLQHSELNGDIDDDDDVADASLYKRKYEWSLREMELLKKQLKQQQEDDLDQLLLLKKQLEKKVADAYEETDEQRQVVAQLRKKSQRLQAEMNDLKILLEEQTSRNNLLEKKQRKFDQDMQNVHDELRNERLNKDKIQRDKDQILAEKYSFEQEVLTLKLELELKEEKVNSLTRELEDLNFTGKAEEEVATLKKAKHDLELRIKDQEEELDDLAGQVQMLEGAKVRLEMSIEQMRKEHRKEISQREEELEEVRVSSQKKVKALEAQLESEHDDRTQLVREKHELERRLIEAQDHTLTTVDEDYVHRLKKELKKTKALLKDTQTMLVKAQSEGSSKLILRQLKTQLEDAEFAKTAAIKARQSAEADLCELQSQLEEAQRLRKDAEDKCARIAKEKADIHTQLDESEEEVAEVMKKYKATVSQLSVDQVTLSEQSQIIAELEHEKQILHERLTELSSKVEVLEGETANIHTQRRLEMKIKELESKLELEQTTRQRLESQISRLKDQIEKLGQECDSVRRKEAQALDHGKKSSRQLREAKEDLSGMQQRFTDAANKKQELEKQLELSDAEVITLKNDLKLAFKRIEDLQQALQGDMSDSDTDLSDSRGESGLSPGSEAMSAISEDLDEHPPAESFA